MQEVELLSSISPELFEQKVAQFRTKYGEPSVQKRLGIIIGGHSYSKMIDTRIKITNGQAHIVQKIGRAKNGRRSAEEIDIRLDMNAEELLSFIRLMQGFGKVNPGFISLIQQYDNLLFDTPDAEVKFYKQSNLINTCYGFEVELTDHKRDLDEVCTELGLEQDNIVRDKAFWLKYDYDYNIDGLTISDEDLLLLIEKHLDLSR
jgi:hypothetical protein